MQSFDIGKVSVAARGFRRDGRLAVTAIVKGTFALIADKPMALSEPEPIVHEEQRVSQGPVASLKHASDLALALHRPEVVVVGDACAPRGTRVTRLRVGLEVVRNGRTIIAKTLEAIGERRGRREEAPPEPQPFERMPIVYERAYGGLSHRENPVGVGMEPHSDGTVSWPSFIVVPGGIAHAKVADPSTIVAGLGPISAIWPTRKAERGSASHQDASFAEVFDWPADLDENYFQAAQIDQQVVDLLPGDCVILTGMHPHYDKLRSFLPDIAGFALAQAKGGARYPFALRIDVIHIDVNAQRAEIIWRGSSRVDEHDLAGLMVAGMLAKPGETPSFVDLTTLAQSRAAAQATSKPKAGLQTTQVMEPTAEETRERGHSGTLVITPDAPTRRPTLELSASDAPESLPFRGRHKPVHDAKVVPPPGSPWAESPSEHAQPVPADLVSTFVTDLTADATPSTERASGSGASPAGLTPRGSARLPAVDATVDLSAKADDPSAPSAPKLEQKRVEPKKALWRKDPEPPPEKPPTPELPRADLKGQIYKKLKR